MTAARLRNLDEFSGKPTGLRGDDLGRALGDAGRGRGGLGGRLAEAQWRSAGYDVDNPNIQNLIRQGYHPDDVISLFRGQGDIYPEVLSPAARAGGIELSEQRLREIYPGFPAPEGDPFLQRLMMHKSNVYGGGPEDPFIAMTTNYEVARDYALVNAESGTSPVVLEAVVPKSMVRSMPGHHEFEYVIAHHLPDEYITDVYRVNSKTFSPELEAGLKILEQHEPGFAHLLRNEVIPVLGERPPELAAASIGPRGMRYITSDPKYPGSTAMALYEEIYHTFQGPMKGRALEIEAHIAAVEWALRHNLELRPGLRSSLDANMYRKMGSVEGIEYAVQELYGNLRIDDIPYLEYDFPPGMLYRFDINQFRQLREY